MADVAIKAFIVFFIRAAFNNLFRAFKRGIVLIEQLRSKSRFTF